jgi:DNA polymerase-3 subunit delta'
MLLKETIIGNERAAEILEKGYKSGKLSHAYLFTGPEHLGKKTLALNFCKILLQDGSTALRDNGANEDIQNNLDLTIISPDEDEKQITIEKIRDLEKKLALYPHSAKYKIAIIEQAEKMNKSAANALLKTLEEPSKTAILILLASDSKNMLDTIKSRCQLIKFLPVKKSLLQEFLKDKISNKNEAEKIIEMSGYRPGKIIEFVNDKNKIKEALDNINKISSVIKGGENEKLDEAENISKKEINEIVSILNLLTVYFRRYLIKEYKNNNCVNKNNLLKIKERIELVGRTKENLLTKNVNAKLAVENLFLSL